MQEIIPQQFAYKILRKLSKGGLVSISRGADGGCRLVADLNQKSLYDLMIMMDSAELINACLKPGYQCSWRQSTAKRCEIHHKLEEIQRAVDQQLMSHSLAEILCPEKSS